MRIQMSDEDARRLADKLAYDDEFRTALEKDPQGVLREFQIELEPDDLRKVVRLPSKTDVRRAIDEVEEAATGKELFYDMIAFLFSVLPPSPRAEVGKRAPKKKKKKSAKGK